MMDHVVTFGLVWLLVGGLIWLPLSEEHRNFVHVWFARKGRVAATTDLAVAIALMIVLWPVVAYFLAKGVAKGFFTVSKE